VTGKQLYSIRWQLGMTQVQFAEALGVTANTVARWERNELPITTAREKHIELLTKSLDTQETGDRAKLGRSIYKERSKWVWEPWKASDKQKKGE
jgi:transcriptional regulator with XRE-family HTH domain